MPSWARSDKKGSTSSKATGRESKVNPPSVKSHSSGGEIKKVKPVIEKNSEAQFNAALIELLAKVVDKGADNRSGQSGNFKTKLTSIQCDKWSGDRKLTARQYRAWKKHIQGIAQYHTLSDTESAFLISLNVTGQAKIALDIFENEDFANPKI